MYQIYKVVSYLIYPLVILLLALRVKKGKEDPLRYKEKLGFSKVKRPSGKLIWFHAASIGEFNAILPIIKSIAEEFPSLNILVTTVTITAAKIAQNNLPKNAIHQFAPLDCYNIVSRFIDYWQPNLVIWTESEFWPNMLMLCKKRAKLLLINARLSQKSFAKWNLVKPLAKFILDSFSLILAQSQETKLLLEQLDVKHVEYVGNLKFIAANFVFNLDEVSKIKSQIKNRVVLMAASTHSGEEEMFAQLQQDLKVKYPQLLSIIAPRHPSRREEVLDVFKQFKLKAVTRSSGEAVTDDTDILLVDTIGEFGLFFRLSEIACTGGSWHRIGHSFIEPAKLGNLIIFGSRMDNSREVADDFLARGGAIEANTVADLERIVAAYIESPTSFNHFKEQGEKLVDEMNEVKEKALLAIRPYVVEVVKLG